MIDRDLNALALKGEIMDTLASQYIQKCGISDVGRAKERIARVVDGFLSVFDCKDNVPIAIFSAPGRAEIAGNHTDHQHGHVLCASVNIDILACAAPNNQNVIRICSQGYPEVTVELDCLTPDSDEAGSSAALVRGLAAGISQLGYTVSGFDAYIISDVLSGSGLSSSAAYEVLIGNIINHFFCEGKLDPIEIARIGQYAENVYFGKPCGLMDQLACSVGGITSIDLADPSAPQVKRIDCDFNAFGYELCILDTGSNHADLTQDYADITREMGAVAAYFGAKVLRAVPEAEFAAEIPQLRSVCGDRAVLRAMHYYEDDVRAEKEANALEQGDFSAFLSLVNESGLSSELHLQNVWSASNPERQAVTLALAVGRKLLAASGAIRVHGGGFAGTVQAFVPSDRVLQFKADMERIFGQDACHILRIRPCGGCVVIG